MDGQSRRGWWRTSSLVCPNDRTLLAAGREALRCPQCHDQFPVVNGIPNFLLDSPKRWQAAQAYELNFWQGQAPSQQTLRSEQCRVGGEGLAQRLSQQVGLSWQGRVLQIGPAAEGEINYLRTPERFALEPLACELDARGLLNRDQVRWVAGMGERLPFPDGFFSAILITNVLDHVADPRAVLSEIRRCLAPNGLVWLTCHVTTTVLQPLFRLLHHMGIGYFAGHLWSFSERRLDRLCREAGLQIRDSGSRRHQLGEFGCQGSLRRLLKPLVLKDHYLLLEGNRSPTASIAPHRLSA